MAQPRATRPSRSIRHTNSGATNPSRFVIGTFNVRGFNSATKRDQLSDDLGRLHVDVCCLQETKCPDGFDERCGNYRHIGMPSQSRHYGLAFSVRRTAFTHHRNENAKVESRKDQERQHVMRWNKTHITKSTLSTKVTGTRPRGRPKMRWLDRPTSDMRIYGINTEMATDRECRAFMVKNVDTTQMVEDGKG